MDLGDANDFWIDKLISLFLTERFLSRDTNSILYNSLIGELQHFVAVGLCGNVLVDRGIRTTLNDISL